MRSLFYFFYQLHNFFFLYIFFLVFIYFLQTYYNIYFCLILFFYFFPSSDNSLYLSFALSLSLNLYHFDNIPWLYLVFFSFSLIISFFTHIYILLKKIIMIHFFIYVRIFHCISCNIFALIPKMNSIITSFNRNNSNIRKIHSFLH